MSYAPAVRRPWGMKPVIGLGVAGPEVDRRLGVRNPGMSWTGGTSSTLECAKDPRGLEHDL
jgi:hypothetical protein